jgi:putative transposase
MYSITTFRQLLKGLPRETFDKLVNQRNADKYCKHFRHWDHLVTMMYAQLSDAKGLRPLETAFNSHSAHHYHLGTRRLKRSTLADANEKRGDGVFRDIASSLMTKVAGTIRKDAKDLLYLLDSTSITLKGREFDRWTQDNRTSRTQGIKVHVLLNADSVAPEWQTFSAANVNDVSLTAEVPLTPGAQYVFDKGYCDYNWWHKIDCAGAVFVTRFKSNAALKVEQELDIAEQEQAHILQDQIVRFKHSKNRGGAINNYHAPLRRVVVARPDKGTPLIIATNDLKSPASQIAQRYKDRWGIELFFKWIKQHLTIKRFFGRSENAVRIQLLTALISYLLVVLYQKTHAPTRTLWDCLCMVTATLFQRVVTEDSYHRRRRQNQLEAGLRQSCLF